MTKAQRALVDIQRKQSESRSRLSLLASKETRTTEEESELTAVEGQLSALEPELRVALAASAAEDDDARTVQTSDPENREKREIRSKTGVADFLRAACGGREVSGAAAEYASACGVSSLNRLPLEIFRDGQPETRAVTGGPAIDGPVEQAVPYIFQRSAASALGIQMPMHGAGRVQIPRVTTPPPADILAQDAAAPASAAVIALDSQAPKRIAGKFEINVEDLTVYPELESVLGESIRGALSNELDDQVFNGNAAGLNGLFLQASNTSVASAVETFATGIGRFAELVDGLHSFALSDLRCVVGPSTYAKYMGLISDGVPLGDYLETKLGSFRVSNRMPSVTNKGQKGLVTLNAGSSPIRIYVWSALEIVRDPFSGAGSGKVSVTATALLSEVYVPFGVAQVKEINPKLNA